MNLFIFTLFIHRANSFIYIVTTILSKSHSRAASKWKKIHIYDKDRVYIQLNSYSHSVLLHNIASLYVFFYFPNKRNLNCMALRAIKNL